MRVTRDGQGTGVWGENISQKFCSPRVRVQGTRQTARPCIKRFLKHGLAGRWFFGAYFIWNKFLNGVVDNNLSPTVDVTYLLSHMAKDRSAYPCSSPTRIKIRTIRLTRMVIRVIVFFKGGKILSSISSRELLQMLNKDGWVTKNQEGSHIQLIHN